MKKAVARFLLVIVMLSVSLFAQRGVDFTKETLEGKRITFSKFYAEKVTLVNFWALWCKPCRIEMKALKVLEKKYSDSGFQILGINLDSPRSVAKVESFVRSQNLPYQIIIDPNKELFEEFNGQVVPLTILYNKAGDILYQNTGYLPGDEFKLEEEIKAALGIE